MRLAIEASPGEVAAAVEDAIRAVAAAAVADGASRDDVRERIAKAVGASKISRATGSKPIWNVIADANAEAERIYAAAMKKAQAAIVARLEQAIADADRSQYLEKLK